MSDKALEYIKYNLFLLVSHCVLSSWSWRLKCFFVYCGSEALGISACNVESRVRLYSIHSWWLEKTTVWRPGATVWRSGAWWFFCWRGNWTACCSSFWFVTWWSFAWWFFWWWWSGRLPLLVTERSYFWIFSPRRKNWGNRFPRWKWTSSIDIESLQNRLLKVCYVPATSASLTRVSFFFSFLFLLLQPLPVLMKQARCS